MAIITYVLAAAGVVVDWHCDHGHHRVRRSALCSHRGAACGLEIGWHLCVVMVVGDAANLGAVGGAAVKMWMASRDLQ